MTSTAGKYQRGPFELKAQLSQEVNGYIDFYRVFYVDLLWLRSGDVFSFVEISAAGVGQNAYI